eukprot:g8372.t1
MPGVENLKFPGEEVTFGESVARKMEPLEEKFSSLQEERKELTSNIEALATMMHTVGEMGADALLISGESVLKGRVWDTRHAVLASSMPQHRPEDFVEIKPFPGRREEEFTLSIQRLACCGVSSYLVPGDSIPFEDQPLNINGDLVINGTTLTLRDEMTLNNIRAEIDKIEGIRTQVTCVKRETPDPQGGVIPGKYLLTIHTTELGKAVLLEGTDPFVLEGLNIDSGEPEDQLTAQFEVNGTPIERPSNTITDVLVGVELQLKRSTHGVDPNLRINTRVEGDTEEAISVTFKFMHEIAKMWRDLSRELERDERHQALPDSHLVSSMQSNTLKREIQALIGRFMKMVGQDAVFCKTTYGIEIDHERGFIFDEKKFIEACRKDPQRAASFFASDLTIESQELTPVSLDVSQISRSIDVTVKLVPNLVTGEITATFQENIPPSPSRPPPSPEYEAKVVGNDCIYPPEELGLGRMLISISETLKQRLLVQQAPQEWTTVLHFSRGFSGEFAQLMQRFYVPETMDGFLKQDLDRWTRESEQKASAIEKQEHLINRTYNKMAREFLERSKAIQKAQDMEKISARMMKQLLKTGKGDE